MITDVLTIITSVAGILGAYQFLIFLRKYYERPKVKIGILPYDEIDLGLLKLEDIGRRSGPDEFLFYDEIFAKRIDEHDVYMVMGSASKSVRKIQRNPSDKYDLPIIVYNKGRSTLADYKLTISFSETWAGEVRSDTVLKLVDVETETAQIDGLYVDPNTYLGQRHREKIPSEKIRRSYEYIGLSANFVTLKGELSSGIYEMIHLIIQIPKEITRIAMYYEVDSKGEIPKAIRYGQYVLIESDVKGEQGTAADG